MKETVLIKSTPNKKLQNVIPIIGLLFIILSFVIIYTNPEIQDKMRFFRAVSEESSKLAAQAPNAFWYAFIKNGLMKFLIIADILVFVVSGMTFLLCRSEIQVTDKRVSGVTAFGKRVDLPVDSITAVTTGLFQAISVSTPSGCVSFSALSNRDAIYTTISKLLAQRQCR